MVTIPIGIGELIDKLSILRVKQIMVSNQNKLEFVNKEFELLYNFSSMYLDDEQIYNIYHELVDTNSILWKIEDELRIKEKNKSFDDEFVNLARKVYITNDIRFSLKNKINELFNSEIREQKDYVKY
jgi:hypothetical protein